MNREDKKTVFYAKVPNAHSAEYLPGDRIVVALSTAENGNAIRLYDAGHSDKILFPIVFIQAMVWYGMMKRTVCLPLVLIN